MKFLYIIILFLFSTPGIGQTIKGNITSTDGGPLSNISVKLEGTDFGTRTAENGDFTLRNVKPGTYTLVASGIGYSATKQNLIVINGKKNFLTLELDKATQQLSEVIIGSRRTRQRDKASSIAARLPLSNIENPQAINTVSNQVITEQAATDLNSIIKNIPGVVKAWSSVSAYYTSRGFNTRNYIRNGVSGYSTADPDIVNIEQLVAVKGPSGTLFGSTLASFGGVLNRITKKPFDTTHVEIAYQGGSYDLNRFTADINTPLNKDKTVLLRVNAAQHYEGSFQDAGFLRSTFIAPSLYYKASDRLSFSLDAEFFNREGTSLPQITPVGPIQPGSTKTWASNPSRLPLDYTRYYGNNSVTLKDPARSFYGQVNYKISDQWTSQTNLTRTGTENTGNYLTFTLLKGDSALVRNVSNYPASLITISQIQQNFIGDFKLGKLRNRLVVGLEFYQNSSAFASNSLAGSGGRKAFDTLFVTRSMPNYELIGPANIANKLNGLAATYSSSRVNTYAAYASDVINVTDRLSALLSLRVDRFNNKGTTNTTTNVTTGNYDQTAFAPKFGLVYQVVKDHVSLFGNYNNGFQNVAPATQPDGSVSAFKPQYANQLEGGLKAELAHDLLSATISYYNIKVENTLRPDVLRPAFTVQEGTQFSRGVEIDLFSRPVNGLLINTGFTYNDSKLTSANGTVNGLRPVNSGPDKTVNFYTSYNLPFTSMQGLGIGFGGNYYSRNLIVNNTTNGQFYLNSYALFNGAIFYNRPRYRFAVNADNLGDKKYYNGGFGTITPGMLRRYMATLTLKF
ncbi:iron complex outermembrane receptor protein [Mucilaginibacter gracilis]|uniref:Iron complex outermembrane receptor protein n=1 Tax=Mucilaginibacter gracilis TaxID=423350 RepID=A0A495J5B9_9SPHI|nr:TonB-dependent receptor [Mucilaginibacter gracilis]RKR84147.1 iron complex outermembrane receptor protein [Mucilaginibacter gracilis]